jgi:class 3 adenylate cyclase
VRAGVHVGELELVGNRLRGIALHEAARIVGRAAPDEILVAEQVKTFAQAAGLSFEDRGVQELKGLLSKRRLFAYVE